MERSRLLWRMANSLVLVLIAGMFFANRGLAAPGAADIPVSASFTYAGVLLINNNPATGTFDLEFRLFDAASGGKQIGSAQVKQDVSVRDGHYSVALNFGSTPFAGSARWLQVARRGSTSTGSFTVITPRELLTGTPYALSVRPGMQITGNVPQPGRGVIRADNTGSGVGLWGSAVNNAGVYGESVSSQGVYGKSTTWQGVYGTSRDQAGVVGESQNFDGVWGQSRNQFKSGVAGINRNGGNGVYGESNTGRGVWGKSDTWQGVYGYSRDQAGVVGESQNFDGVWGQSRNQFKAGVAGINQNGGTGVYGESNTGYAGFFNGKVAVKVLEIQGGADLAERFETAGDAAVGAGSLVVIDADNPGKLKLSDRPYDTGVAGVVSGAGGVNPGLLLHQEGVTEGELVVAMTGRVYVKAEAFSGPIKPGDLLTTSSLPGHAMRATDVARRDGTIVGKAMTGLDSGTGLILVLVNLQ